MATIMSDEAATRSMRVGDPFLLGVNYWPRRKAMYWWADFDAGEVREEFAMIRDLGLTHVRFFLLWESFQPSPDDGERDRAAATCERSATSPPRPG